MPSNLDTYKLVDATIYFHDQVDIDHMIVDHFNTSKIPLAGGIHAEGLSVWKPDKLPFKPTKRESNHRLLITGYNCEGNNPDHYYFEVKNSYTKKWGSLGFGRVATAALNDLTIPEFS